MEKLQKTRKYKEREDLNFKQVYDPEKHIKELTNKKEIQNILNEEEGRALRSAEKESLI